MCIQHWSCVRMCLLISVDVPLESRRPWIVAAPNRALKYNLAVATFRGNTVIFITVWNIVCKACEQHFLWPILTEWFLSSNLSVADVYILDNIKLVMHVNPVFSPAIRGTFWLYSQKIWQEIKLSSLAVNRQIKTRQHFILAYVHVCMVIPYWTANLAMVTWGPTTKFNSRQYFRLCGSFCRLKSSQIFQKVGTMGVVEWYIAIFSGYSTPPKMT